MLFFDLFNKNKFTATVQFINLATMFLAFYNMYEDPDSLYEGSADAFAHAFTFYVLKNNPSFIESFLASGVNVARFGSIWHAMTEGCTHFPFGILVADAIFHLWNSLHTISNSPDQTEVESKEIKLQ